MGVEADEPQVQALASALGLRVRVEYLNAQSVPWSERCGPHRHVVCGPAAAGKAKSRPLLAACLLFRPGHYDVLLPPTGTRRRSTTTPPTTRFVAPLPRSSTPPLLPGVREQRLVACELCAAPCARPGCARAAAPPTTRPPASAAATCSGCYPPPCAGGRAYACARCVAKCPRADGRARVGGGGGGGVGAASVPARLRTARVLRRMYFHLAAGCAPPPELPSPVRRIRPSRIARPTACRPPARPATWSALIEMGFDIADARDALARAGGDVQGAAERCLRGGTGGGRRRRRRRRLWRGRSATARWRCWSASTRSPRRRRLRSRRRATPRLPEPGQVAGIEEAVELLFQPSELRKWRPTNDFSCDVCRRGFSSRHRRDEHTELRRDYAGSCDDADRAHNFIIRYQAAHRIDFNGAREACYEQWRRQGREL